MDNHEFAANLATEAGRLLVRVRREMADASPQELKTAGDQKSHTFITKMLAASRSWQAVLSEEDPAEAIDPATNKPARLSAKEVWIVDPLDGTREFSEPGRTDWAVHIALWGEGRIQAAAVALPALGFVLHTGREIAIRPRPAPTTPFRIAVSRTRPGPIAQAVAESLGAELVPMGSAGAKAMSILRGEADAYIHSGGQFEWDNCAPVGVVRKAGVHASRLDGSDFVYNTESCRVDDLVICRPEYRDALLSEIAKYL